MAEYTWKNLIYNPTLEEAKNAIGKECYFGATPIGCIKNANDDKNSSVLREVRSNEFLPFITSNYGSYSCIIVKEEPNPEYIPFQDGREFFNSYLSVESRLEKEDYFLSNHGIWLMDCENGDYFLVTEIWGDGVVLGSNQETTHWDDLLEYFIFLDGSPCGKLAEEGQ